MATVSLQQTPTMPFLPSPTDFTRTRRRRREGSDSGLEVDPLSLSQTLASEVSPHGPPRKKLRRDSANRLPQLLRVPGSLNGGVSCPTPPTVVTSNGESRFLDLLRLHGFIRTQDASPRVTTSRDSATILIPPSRNFEIHRQQSLSRLLQQSCTERQNFARVTPQGEVAIPYQSLPVLMAGYAQKLMERHQQLAHSPAALPSRPSPAHTQQSPALTPPLTPVVASEPTESGRIPPVRLPPPDACDPLPLLTHPRPTPSSLATLPTNEKYTSALMDSHGKLHSQESFLLPGVNSTLRRVATDLPSPSTTPPPGPLTGASPGAPPKRISPLPALTSQLPPVVHASRTAAALMAAHLRTRCMAGQSLSQAHDEEAAERATRLSRVARWVEDTKVYAGVGGEDVWAWKEGERDPSEWWATKDEGDSGISMVHSRHVHPLYHTSGPFARAHSRHFVGANSAPLVGNVGPNMRQLTANGGIGAFGANWGAALAAALVIRQPQGLNGRSAE
ncbi:hypothetical protein M427DRAFT_132118 [Gonapodya prolifera JEL478]|uniref:Uncharacterized protein n=1 Tax=Gonapodya prolifera (strain JEL478) TaxID=1344416 RepID=A0A139ASC7_GONPJ|nr:hypothetical protein M427DRAFT_132118 [Gonapodya prolifera JEL478]|eukprot:KXS19642.1 hypothetical protein M427DRAFT_132118 [Gonapodya prolifera JEL478]